MSETMRKPTVITTVMASASTNKPAPEKFLYSRKESAFALGVSIRSLDTLVATKQLSTRRLGKKVMIPTAELRRFARADHFTITKSLSEVTA